MKNNKQSGFTLVEIAIVLVIIGLLLGGVMKGQELIKSAKVKALIQEINGYSAAFNTYIDKYGALPGDHATANPDVGTGLANGNGNGDIAGVEGRESLFRHLEAAGLTSGLKAASGYALNKEGKRMFYDTNYAGLNGHTFCTLVTNEQARQIDRKLDDGNGATGSFRRHNQADYPTTAGDSSICSAS